MRQKLIPAMEAISFQKNDLAKNVTEFMQAIFFDCKTATVAKKSGKIEEFEKYILKRCGVKVAISIGVDDGSPYAMPFRITRNIPIEADIKRILFGSDAKYMLKKIKTLKTDSVIDLKNAKMSGWISSIPQLISMPFSFCKTWGLTPGEIAAIFIHELGHLFTYIEYSNKSIITNQVLASVAMALNDKEETKMDMIYKEAGNILEVDSFVIDEVKNINDSAIVSTILISSSAYALRSIFDTNYSNNTAEQLADQFASRCGLGEEIVGGLHKIIKNYPSYTSLVYNIASDVVCTTALLLGLVSAIASGPIHGVLTISIIGANLLFGSHGQELGKDYTYDDMTRRYARIKNDVIEGIKKGAYSKEEIKHRLNSLDVIEKAMSELVDYVPLAGRILNVLRSSNRKKIKIREMQHMLEDLVANDLFVQSAKLKYA